jgi:hypothetical protein
MTFAAPADANAADAAALEATLDACERIGRDDPHDFRCVSFRNSLPMDLC